MRQIPNLTMLIPASLFWSICILLCPIVGYALLADNHEAVHIIADSAIYNYKTGFDIYEGNVNVAQGTTHIEADKLTTQKNKEHKIQEAIAYGVKQLAHFWTLPKPGEPEIHAHAKVIKFYPIEANAILEKEVIVTQGDNSFRGEVIQYNNNEQTITMPPSARGRAVIVYQPDK